MKASRTPILILIIAASGTILGLRPAEAAQKSGSPSLLDKVRKIQVRGLDEGDAGPRLHMAGNIARENAAKRVNDFLWSPQHGFVAENASEDKRHVGMIVLEIISWIMKPETMGPVGHRAGNGLERINELTRRDIRSLAGVMGCMNKRRMLAERLTHHAADPLGGRTGGGWYARNRWVAAFVADAAIASTAIEQSGVPCEDPCGVYGASEPERPPERGIDAIMGVWGGD